MLQAINSFPPGILVFPMLYHYFQTQPLPLSKFLIDALLKPLRSTHSKGRLYALSKLEQSALCRRQPAVVDVKLNGGQTSVAEADPWTTAEEFAQKVLRHSGISDSSGWCVELDSGKENTQISGNQHLFDAIAQLESSNISNSEQNPFVFFKTERKSSLNSAMLAAKHAGNSYLNGVDKSMKQSGISSSEFDSQAFQENNNNNPKLRRFAHPAPIDGNDSKETLNGNKPYASINALSPRRQQNPNCMSRITEEDYSMAGSRENTLQRPSRDYPRLINMMTGYFPSNRMNHRNNDRLSETGYNKVLPPIDYEYGPELVEMVAASIKGGPSGVRHDTNSDGDSRYYRNEAQEEERSEKGMSDRYYREPSYNSPTIGSPFDPKMFMRSAASTSFPDTRDSGPLSPPINYYPSSSTNNYGPRVHMDYNPYEFEPRYQPNGEFREERIYSPAWNASNTVTPQRNGLNRQVQTPVYGNGYHLQTNGIVSDGLPQRNYSDRPVEPNGVRRIMTESSVASRGLDDAENEDDDLGNGQWVHEGEIPFSEPSAFATFPLEHVRRKSSSAKQTSSKQQTKTKPKKNLAAVKFSQQPFSAVIRKEVFESDELLDDGLEIDIIFAQIIADCKKNIPHRIRKYEKESINNILHEHNVPINLLDRLSEIPTNVKTHVINVVRKWPLYFCRLFPVIEERPKDRVHLFLGVSETGIRLISRNVENVQDPMIIQDHFEYSDVAELVLESQKSLRLITRQSISVLITSIQVDIIKRLIEAYLTGSLKNKEFMMANADYSTNEPNLLSFERGNFIEVVNSPDSEPPPSGNWIYGKLDNRFGWIPSDYVQPVVEKEYNNGDEYGIYGTALYGTTAPRVLHMEPGGQAHQAQAHHQESQSQRAGYEMSQEAQEGEFTTYDRSVKYNQERTDYPPVAARQHHHHQYLAEGYSSRGGGHKAIQAPSSRYEDYAAQEIYKGQQAQKVGASAHQEASARSGLAAYERQREMDEYTAGGVSTFGRSAAGAAAKSRSHHHHREWHHQQQSGGTGAAAATKTTQYANGGYYSGGAGGGGFWGNRSKRNASWGTGAYKQTVHHKVNCCCFSFKWPPWSYEECEPPRPLFYDGRARGGMPMGQGPPQMYQQQPQALNHTPGLSPPSQQQPGLASPSSQLPPPQHPY